MATGTQNLINLAKNFTDENTARELLESLRWPNGVLARTAAGPTPTG
jgi:hypothetical protein